MHTREPAAPSRPQNADLGGVPQTLPGTPAATGRALRAIQITLLILAVIYTLALARSFFIPLTLAFLISLVLAPVVKWLAHIHVPRALGAGAVVLALLAGLGFMLSSVLDPIEKWMESAPILLERLEEKVLPLKETVEEVSKTAEKVDRIASVDNKGGAAARVTAGKSLHVRDMLYSNAMGLLAGLVIVTFLLYFFLSWGRVALLRIGELLGDSLEQKRFFALTTTLEVEVSKYLLTITVINILLGAAVAAALYLLGMPNPMLWGTVTALLNFIPYLGAVMSAIVISGAALLSFDGLGQPMLVVGAFGILTILEGQIFTPLVLGRRLALNPLVVFLSVAFWFWLWGVMGALMAVPILITLKLIGDHVGVLGPFAKLAGR